MLLLMLLFAAASAVALVLNAAVPAAAGVGGAVLKPGSAIDKAVEDIISFAFGVATVVTNKGKAMFADRVRTTPATYTTSPKFCAMGTGATGAARTAVAADTALSTEVETRASGTESVVTTTQTGDTYQSVGTQTATATRSVDEAGLFDASTVGNMFTSATLAVISLANGDSIQWTWKVQLT